MDADAVAQLSEARAHILPDWYPPLMSALWGVFDRVIPGPFSMLLLQNLMFWAGLAIIFSLSGRPATVTAAAVLLIGLFPPVFSALGTIWKDVAMGATVLTGLPSAASGTVFVQQAPRRGVPMESGDRTAPSATPRAARLKRLVNGLGAASLLADVSLAAVNASLAQANFRRPPARRLLRRRY